MNQWPGNWHSKAGTSDSLTNDNGLLFLSGETGTEYLWYEPSGHDPRTEVRR